MAKIYIASPLFTDEERRKVRDIAERMRDRGHQVYVPMEQHVENAWDLPNHVWAKRVFEEDVKAIDEADLVLVLYYGLYSDSGTAWECGYAYAKGKQVFVKNCECEEASLMIVNGQSAKWLEEFKNVPQT